MNTWRFSFGACCHKQHEPPAIKNNGTSGFKTIDVCRDIAIFILMSLPTQCKRPASFNRQRHRQRQRQKQRQRQIGRQIDRQAGPDRLIDSIIQRGTGKGRIERESSSFAYPRVSFPPSEMLTEGWRDGERPSTWFTRIYSDVLSS